MDQRSILSKSPKGVEEIETRRHKLDARLRSILITVNGKLTAGELAARFGQLGDITGMLQELLRQGFLQEAARPAAADPKRLASAQGELAGLINAALGPDGEDIALKIEKAKTPDDLRAYLESRRDMLEDAMGKARAAAFWTKANELLG